LTITDTELSDIASAATIGLRRTPKGDKPINAFPPADPATLQKFKMPCFYKSKTRSVRQFERDLE
jgi:hypothetical protein